jgi:hypothetical protein
VKLNQQSQFLLRDVGNHLVRLITLFEFLRRIFYCVQRRVFLAPNAWVIRNRQFFDKNALFFGQYLENGTGYPRFFSRLLEKHTVAHLIYDYEPQLCG